VTTPTITFEINGEQVPATAALWYEIAPCGCAAGATTIMLPGDPTYTPKVTEDDAWHSFYDGQPGAAEHIRRQKAAGFRMEVGLRSEITERMKDSCPHDPKWGVVDPCPDGYTWAVRDGSRRMHLVPGAKDRNARFVHGLTFSEAYDRGPVAALCGRSERLWSTHWVLTGAPHCLACERKAADR